MHVTRVESGLLVSLQPGETGIQNIGQAHTICKAFIMLLEIGLGTLTPCTNGHRVVFIRVARRRELVQVGSSLVLSDHEETDTVRSAPVFLSVNLRLFHFCENRRKLLAVLDLLSAMADTSLLTGTGLLNTILEDIACWRMKLLANGSQDELSEL